MAPTPPSPGNDRRPGLTFFIVMVIIVVGSILLFLILRPNPSGNTPKNPATTPASQQ